MVAVYDQDVVFQAPAAEPIAVLRELARRLERGLAMIEARSAEGLSVDHHEDHWIELLNEYEQVFDNLA